MSARLLLSILLLITFSSGFEASAKNNRRGIINLKQPDEDLTLLGLVVGKSTLADVSEKLKGNEIFTQGDAGSHLSVLCYEGKDGITVAFESGEMGGRNHLLTAAAVYADKEKYRLGDHCSPNVMTANDAVIAGVSLGMSSEDLVKLKGKPTHLSPTLIQYVYEISTKKRDTTSALKCTMAHNKIVRIEITKVVSN